MFKRTDLLCINQEDVDERTHQVRKMVDIYKNAVQVWIWMGEAVKHLDAAISLMQRCKRSMDKDGRGIEGLVSFAESKFRSPGWEALTSEPTCRSLFRPTSSRSVVVEGPQR
jgi:hypothetical protein